MNISFTLQVTISYPILNHDIRLLVLQCLLTWHYFSVHIKQQSADSFEYQFHFTGNYFIPHLKQCNQIPCNAMCFSLALFRCPHQTAVRHYF